jgi:hypothetical protein
MIKTHTHPLFVPSFDHKSLKPAHLNPAQVECSAHNLRTIPHLAAGLTRFFGLLGIARIQSRAIVSYNASAVKIHNALFSLARFEYKNIFYNVCKSALPL